MVRKNSKVLFVLICIVTILQGCGYNELKENAPELAIKFYEGLNNPDQLYDSGLFSNRFQENTSEVELLTLVKNMGTRFGRPKELNLDRLDSKLNITTRGIFQTVTLTYSLTYSNAYDSVETFIIISENGRPKILSYTISLPVNAEPVLEKTTKIKNEL